MLVCISRRNALGCFLIGVLVAPFADARSSFLGQLNEEDVKEDLVAELKSTFRGGADARIQKLTEALRPLFKALPKDQAGNLEHGVARFALHRFFISRHRWFITGLEPNADTSNATLKDWVPAYIMDNI
jgi:hypothetical protein